VASDDKTEVGDGWLHMVRRRMGMGKLTAMA